MSWFDGIEIGDTARIHPGWNDTTRSKLKIKPETKILDFKANINCETRVMVQVKNIGGNKVWLSAGWFIDPEVENEVD